MVTFPPSSNLETQEITLEVFDDDFTESLMEYYILVVRLDSNSDNNQVDIDSIVFEPRMGFAVICINDDDGKL